MENESNISKKTGTYINTEDNKRINTNVINVDCIKLQFKQIKNEMVSVVNDDIVEENENILIEDIESEKKNDNTFGKTTFDDKRFIEYGGAEVEKKIIVGEIELPLYPTFSSSTKSIKTVKIKCKKVIELLKNKYNLSDFSEENWKEYYYSMNLYFDEKNKVEWYSENNKTVSELQVFFDIYENYEENDKLINMAKQAEDEYSLATDCEFLALLPYFDTEELLGNMDIYKIEEKREEKKITLLDYNVDKEIELQLLRLNKENAIDYAKKYARKPNGHFGYIKNHDCTNFASQIMAAGGKQYTLKWITACVFEKWYYTDAWANANCFANYWGVDTVYRTHKIFSKNLKKGDFITEDKANDGSWDYIGFVVDVANSYNEKLGYKDYKVAQHTSDYLEWASSDKCGWDKLRKNHPDCRFGIDRVN